MRIIPDVDRAWALAEAKHHLEVLVADGVPSRHGWVIDSSRLEDELVLFVAIPSRNSDDTLHWDGPYYHRLQFRAYPTSPPLVEFINPDSRTFDHTKDQRWMPRITSSPPGVSAQFHLFRPDIGRQLVCHSLSLAYYETDHAPGAGEGWDPTTHRFGSSLLLQERLLRLPYYGGRQS